MIIYLNGSAVPWPGSVRPYTNPGLSTCLEERRICSWVAELFADEHLDDTCAKLADAAPPDTDQWAQEQQIRKPLRGLDQELDSYRTIVGTEPEAASTVGKWIAETNQERRRLEALLGRTPTTRLTTEDVKALVASLRDITPPSPPPTPPTRPGSTPRWGSTSPTTKTAGSSSNPGRVYFESSVGEGT